MNESVRILLVEDDETFRSLLAEILGNEGYDLVEKEDGKAALMALQRQSFDLVISDLRLPGLSGLDFFRAAQEQGIAPPFILLTAFGTVEEAVAAIKEGVADFLTKPLKDPETLRILVRRVLFEDVSRRGLTVLQERESAGLPPADILFAGGVMQEVRGLIKDVAGTQATVLITGESGTGKELVARALHSCSSRRSKPFVAINCAALPETLLEGELFGHTKGAFTGALSDKSGLFEQASGGSLFLDEVGEMPPSLQVKLLRVLQEGEIRRLGASVSRQVDVRVISATARDLQAEVAAGRFREDLYFRLHVFTLQIPPLRDRVDDIPLLVQHITRDCASRIGREPAPRIEPETLRKLMAYTWPGNVRELENILERALVLCDSPSVGEQCLPSHLSGEPTEQTICGLHDHNLSIKQAERAMETDLICKALQKTGGNRTHAAKLLEISHRALLYKLKEYGLD